MKKLELLIPPVILVFIFMAAMTLLHNYAELRPLPQFNNLATFMVIAGAAIALLGVLAFRKAKTTVNPTTPENSSSIVDTGIYRFTRNPMYLGMLLFLIGFGLYLASVSALLTVVLFVPYMTRFQIIPEERILLSLFGDSYQDYQRRVRRWL